MAGPDTRKGSQLALFLGDQATATNFMFVCGIESTTFTLSRSTNERATRQCDTYYAAALMTRTNGTKDHVVAGSGLVSVADTDGKDFNDLMTVLNGDSNYYWKVAVENGPTWTGKFCLNSVEIVGETTAENGLMTISINLSADGVIAYAAAP